MWLFMFAWFCFGNLGIGNVNLFIYVCGYIMDMDIFIYVLFIYI